MSDEGYIIHDVIMFLKEYEHEDASLREIVDGVNHPRDSVHYAVRGLNRSGRVEVSREIGVQINMYRVVEDDDDE